MPSLANKAHMPDATTTVGEMLSAVRQFVAERDWERYHAPKNLAMALACEAAELMEHFLWIEPEQSRALARDPARREAIADELADVLNLLLNLGLSTGIDLSDAFFMKLVKNARKYPVGNCGPSPV